MPNQIKIAVRDFYNNITSFTFFSHSFIEYWMKLFTDI